MLSGTLTGLTGDPWIARHAVAHLDIAAGFEQDAVAACVIAGIAIAVVAGAVAGAVGSARFLAILKIALPVVGRLSALADGHLGQRDPDRHRGERARSARAAVARPRAGEDADMTATTRRIPDR